MSKNTVRERSPAKKKTPRTAPAVAMPLPLLLNLHRFFVCLTSNEPEFDCRETERLQGRLARLIRGHEDALVAEAARAPVEAEVSRLEELLMREQLKPRQEAASVAPRLESVR